MQETDVQAATTDGTVTNDKVVHVPTNEWTTAALAHASVLLTVILGTPGGLGIPIGLAVPLVMYFGYRRNSRFIAFHALQAFVYQVVGTIGIAFSLQATFSARRTGDVVARIVLAGLSLVVVLHPDMQLAGLAVAPVAAFVAYWLWRGKKMVAA